MIRLFFQRQKRLFHFCPKEYLFYLIVPVFFTVFLVFGAVLFQGVTPGSVTATAAADCALIALGGLFYLSFLQKKQRGLPKRRLFSVLAVLYLPLMWIATQTGSQMLMDLYPQSMDTYNAMVSDEMDWYVILTMVIAPFAEEVLFRGLWFSCIKRLMGRVPAYVVSVLLFSWMHQTIPQFYLAVFCGILFAFVYEVTGKLRWAVFFHMAYNTACILFSGIFLLDIWYEMSVFVIITILNVAAAGCLLWFSGRHDMVLKAG